jgi:hypothetical protein
MIRRRRGAKHPSLLEFLTLRQENTQEMNRETGQTTWEDAQSWNAGKFLYPKRAIVRPLSKVFLQKKIGKHEAGHSSFDVPAAPLYLVHLHLHNKTKHTNKRYWWEKCSKNTRYQETLGAANKNHEGGTKQMEEARRKRSWQGGLQAEHTDHGMGIGTISCE